MNYQWRDLVGSLVDGKYPLIEYLGDVAGHGVYATDPVDSWPAIVRLMPGGTEESNRMLERWQAATALAHPNLAKTFAAVRRKSSGTQLYSRSPRRPDDSLAEAVRNRPLTEQEARVLTDSVLGALAYLHQNGFAHGAVAPDNIVAMGEQIKLAPWTIAQSRHKERSKRRFRDGANHRGGADPETSHRGRDASAPSQAL